MSSITYNFLSEGIAEAIRNNDFEEVSNSSSSAAVILPLLKALGWQSYSRELIEALPHFSSHLDLVDLRNMFVNLGYESDPINIPLHKLEDGLMPCLFIKNKQVYVILEKFDTGFRYFNAQTLEEEIGELKGQGELYSFTNTNTTHVVGSNEKVGWFNQLGLRFKGIIKHLLAMTFLLNLIALAVPFYIMAIYDRIIGAGSTDALPYFAIGMGFVLLIEFGFRYLRSKTLGVISGRLDYIVGVETLRQILSMHPGMTENSSVSAQLSRIRQFDAIREFFSGPSAMLFIELPFVILFLVVIGILAGPVAFIPGVVLLLYAIFSLYWIPVLKEKSRVAGENRVLREKMLMETFNGLKELKSLGAENLWRERFRETMASSVMANLKMNMHQNILQNVTTMIMMMAAASVLTLGTFRVMDGDMSIGALIATMALLWRVLGPLQGLFMAFIRYEQVKSGIKMINQLMTIKPESHTENASLLSPEVNGHIQFDRVSFRYGPRLDPVLMGLSFDVQPREFVVLLGHNGSGKSTIAKLIFSMYEPQAGAIRIDGSDTRQYNANDLRRLVAYVPQVPHLFYGSIAQNIRLKNALATDKDIEHACARAGILGAINQLPEGLNTRVGDQHTDRLPSSLVRGICLARAFVRRSPIIVLDEPGTSLDDVNDKKLIAQLKSIKGTATILMISHRPSHIKLADKVVVLEQGMVKDICSPEKAIQEQFK